jgi:chromosome segregation ATPase
MPERYQGIQQGSGADRPPPRSGRDLQEQIALLTAQVRRLGERLSLAAPQDEPADAPISDERHGVDSYSASILATAESVAAEIRSSAAREAQLLREDTARRADGGLAGLAAMIEHHRDTVSALAVESERIERASAVLRAQVRALDGELQAIRDAVAALRSPPHD